MTGPKRLRWRIADEIKRSSLVPDARHILWVLLSDADVDTGVVPAQFSPSLSSLATDTGLARSTVAARLKDLRTSGWLDVDAPSVADQRSKKARNRYRLSLPTGPRAGLVRGSDQSEGRTNAGPGAGPVLVRETDRTSPGLGLTTDADAAGHHQTAPARADVWRGRDEVVAEVVEFLAQPQTWSEDRVRVALGAWETSPKPPHSVDAVCRSMIKKRDAAGLLSRLRAASPAVARAASQMPTCGNCEAGEWPNPDWPEMPCPSQAERTLTGPDGRVRKCPECNTRGVRSAS